MEQERAGRPADGWQVRRRRRLLDTQWLQVDVEDVALPDGRLIEDYYVVREPDFVMVLAVTIDGLAVLVRQYKHGIGRVVLELPAGYLDRGDRSPAEAVRRELREETGYAAAEVRHLASLVNSPTRSPSCGHYFLATGCRPVGGQQLDPAERIAVVLTPLAELPALIRTGTIEVQSSVAGVYLGLAALRGA